MKIISTYAGPSESFFLKIQGNSLLTIDSNGILF